MSDSSMTATEGTTLVTGGAGYIGSHTVRALREAGRPVVVLDTLELGREDAVLGAPLVVGDIATPGLVEGLCKEHGVTSIIHFAAYKSVGESMQLPAKYWTNNVGGTVAMVEEALRSGVDQIVFSSSCSVYGNPEHVPVDETAVLAPESVYAESKATVERILGWYDVTRGLRSVSLRYFNAAGASRDAAIGEDWTYSINLVPLVMKAMLTGSPKLTVFGTDYDTPDGTCIRDYIHVDDLADAHLKAVDHLAAGGTTTSVNLGTGVGSSVMEVIKTSERIARRDVPYTLGPRRAGDPSTTYADPSRAKDLLGWTPQYDLEDIIRTAYAWHAKTV